MLTEENKNISKEFKSALWETTKKEVYELINKDNLDNNQKSLIEEFYIRPLFWSKLNFFIGTMNVHNDVAIDDILQDTKLSEDEQKEFLSLLAKKLDIETTDNLDVDAKNIHNKLFYVSDFIIPELNKLKDIEEVQAVIVNGKTITNLMEYEKLNNNFIGALIEERLRTSVFVSKIENYPITRETITAYKDLDTTTFNNNEIKVILKNNTNQEILKVNVVENDKIEFTYNKPILSISLENIDESVMQINYAESDIGIFNRNIKFSFEGPIYDGKVHITYAKELSPETLIDIYKTTNGYKTIIEYQKPCRVSFFLNKDNKEDIDYVRDTLNGITGYSDFVKTFRENVYPYLFSRNNTITEMYADIYLSPFVYKRVLFGINGIRVDNSKLLNLIPEAELMMLIDTVEYKEKSTSCLV
jgi:hypothetical protein